MGLFDKLKKNETTSNSIKRTNVSLKLNVEI